MASFPFNSHVTLTATFRDGGTLSDPSAVVLQLKDPAGVESTPANATTGTGVFVANVQGTVAGTWTMRWVGTSIGADNLTAAFEDTFTINATSFTSP